MSDNTILNGNIRNNTGKGSARAARRAGRIPAIIYGEKKDTISIDIEEREYKKLMNQSGIFSRLLDISVEGTGKPIVPLNLSLIGFIVTIGDVSVKP